MHLVTDINGIQIAFLCYAYKLEYGIHGVHSSSIEFMVHLQIHIQSTF
jgi:hypothetical protein